MSLAGFQDRSDVDPGAERRLVRQADGAAQEVGPRVCAGGLHALRSTDGGERKQEY
jgi:hypothetical protein